MTVARIREARKPFVAGRIRANRGDYTIVLCAWALVVGSMMFISDFLYATLP